jgi:hypothetical protein
MMNPPDHDQPPAKLTTTEACGLGAFFLLGTLISVLGILSLFRWIAALF